MQGILKKNAAELKKDIEQIGAALEFEEFWGFGGKITRVRGTEAINVLIEIPISRGNSTWPPRSAPWSISKP